jgi:DNA-binding NarL/FixJ family response regulator
MKSRLEHAFNEIVLAGNQGIYLNGLSNTLDRLGAGMRISKAGNQKELKGFLQKEKHPDLVVLVTPLLHQNGTAVLDKIYKLKGKCKVMLMADELELPLVFSFVKEGVKTALSKSCTEEHLTEALNSIFRDSFFFSPVFAETVINKGLNNLSLKGKAKLLQISDREKEIIRLMWKDFTNKEIAEMLQLSIRTLETHRNNIYQKLNVKTLGGIFKFGIENGIIT